MKLTHSTTKDTRYAVLALIENKEDWLTIDCDVVILTTNLTLNLEIVSRIVIPRTFDKRTWRKETIVFLKEKRCMIDHVRFRLKKR